MKILTYHEELKYVRYSFAVGYFDFTAFHPKISPRKKTHSFGASQ